MDTKQRRQELADRIIENFKELANLNSQTSDVHMMTDVVLLVGQHRHEFEDQKVADHSKCLSFVGRTGGRVGIMGLLYAFAAYDEQAKKVFLEVANFIEYGTEE